MVQQPEMLSHAHLLSTESFHVVVFSVQSFGRAIKSPYVLNKLKRWCAMCTYSCLLSLHG